MNPFFTSCLLSTLCRKGALFLVLVLSTLAVQAQYHWTGATSSDWNTPSNWSTNTVPVAGSGGIVGISAGKPFMPVITNNVVTCSVIISPGASLTIANGGSLTINESNELFDTPLLNDGTVVNNGQLFIGSAPFPYSNPDFGIQSGGVFINNGELSINRVSAGIYTPNGTFTNNGHVRIGNENAIDYTGIYGISGSFTNSATGEITIDRFRSVAIYNFSTSSLLNQGKITIGSIASGAGTTAVNNLGTFNNSGCSALMDIVNNTVITNTGTFTNSGAIIERATGNSNISTNTGTVLNLNGGNFNIGSGTLATTSLALVWTGCTNSDWNTASNWNLARVPLATDDVHLPAGPAIQPVISTTAVAKSIVVSNGASLTISATGSLTINGSYDTYVKNAIYSEGTIRNDGKLYIGTTATDANIGIWNSNSFINNGELSINNVSGIGLYLYGGTFTNTGKLHIGNAALAAQDGIQSQGGTLINSTTGEITIDRAWSNAIWNLSGSTQNAGKITIGSLASTGTGILNYASFSNLAGGDIKISQAAAGIVNTATFTNEACASITSFRKIDNRSSFTNAGLFIVDTDQPHSNTALTNNGVISYPQGNPIPNVTNNALIASPIAGCNAISPALDKGGSSPFTVGPTWYTDGDRTNAAGTYDAGTNTFTSSGLAGGSSYTLYFPVSTNACSQTVPIKVTLNGAPDAPALTGASLSVNASTTPLALTTFVTADAGNTLSFYGPSGLLNPPTADISTVGVQTFSAVQTNSAGCSGPATVFSLTVVNNNVTQPPLSQTVCRGSRVVLTVVVEGASSYRWFETGQNPKSQMSDKAGVQQGTATNSLTLVSVQNTSNYFCRVTMSDGSIMWLGQYNVTVNKKCSARLGAEELTPLTLTLLSNPIEGGQLRAVVRGAASQSLTVQLYNLQGQALHQQGFEQADEEQVIDWDLSRQPDGLYLLRAISNGRVQQVKVLKQR